MLAGLESGVLLGRLLEEGANQPEPLPVIDPALIQGIIDPARAGGYGTALRALEEAPKDPGGRRPTAGRRQNGQRGAGDFLSQAANYLTPPGQAHNNNEKRGITAEGQRSDSRSAGTPAPLGGGLGRLGG